MGFFFLPLFWQLKNSGREKEKDHSAGGPGPGVLPPARPVSVPCPSRARPGWVLPARRSASSVVARCHRASPGTGAGGLVEPRHSTEPPTPLCLGPGLSLPLGADPVEGAAWEKAGAGREPVGPFSPYNCTRHCCARDLYLEVVCCYLYGNGAIRACLACLLLLTPGLFLSLFFAGELCFLSITRRELAGPKTQVRLRIRKVQR